MSALTVRACTEEQKLPVLPCHVGEPDLWFAETPTDLERAKELCADCPIRRQCLAAALEREEPWGVWGGEIFERGTIVARKRPRGRPRRDAVAA
ncbi:transcriptional regulator WhiB7 [soil metagenome]